MAKESYKIPCGLDATYLDMEIALQSSDGIGVRPLSMKVILVYLLSGLGCIWMVMNGFVRFGTIVQKILFVVLWIAITMLLVKTDGTHRMSFVMIPTLITYLQKSTRRILTRKDNSAIPFYSIVGIKKDGIDRKTGLISWADGTYGFMYRVVGSASILLFDADKVAIIDRVDSFYRKMNTDSEVIFLTTKSAQAVYKQVQSLKKLYDNLQDDDPDLKMLANEQFGVLKNYVGGSFRAIHQYMIIKSDNMEELKKSKAVLQSELENSTLMIKRCVPLYYDDIINVLQLVYRGKDGGKA